MSDSPSPVRASAQEQAKALHLKLDRAGAEWPHGSTPGTVCYPCSLIEAALSAAEARGRQQAEQAWDEEIAKLRQEKADAEEETQYEHERFKKRGGELDKLDAKVAALTQALKDCLVVLDGYPEAGLNPDGLLIECEKAAAKARAALTGAQA